MNVIKVFRLSICVLLSSTALVDDTNSQTIDPVVTKDDLVAQVKERLRLFESYSADYKTVGGSNLSGPIADEEVEMKVVCVGSKLRIDRLSSKGGRNLCVFDGQNVTLLSTGKMPTFQNAVLSRDPSFIPWTLPIAAFIYGFHDASLTNWLTEAEITSQSNDTITLADRVSTSEDGMQYQQHLTLSNAIGFPVLRREAYFRRPKSEEWLLSAELTVEEFTMQSGFKIPVKGRYKLFMYEGPSVERKTVSNYLATITNWSFPASERSDTFVIEMPDGIIVDDKVNGKVYRSKRIHDTEVDSAIDSANSFSTPSIYLSTGVLFLVAVASVYAFKSFLGRN